MPPKQAAKVVLVGDSGVGKSTILSSYKGERFNPCFVPTRGEMQNARRKVLKVDVKLTVVQFLDRERNWKC